MKEQDDTLVRLIHDAAGQVGPVAGIDGEAMAERAIRRERVRRSVIGGVAALAVAALVTVGGLAAAGRQVLPGGWPPVEVPDGWTGVSATGLTFAVPPDFEPFEAMGVPAWGIDPNLDGEWSTAASMVLVQPLPLGSDHSLSEMYDEVVGTQVPGAASAEYAWGTAGGMGDFDGALDVELESGRRVRLMLVLTDVPEPEQTFERLVGTVQVDRTFDESVLAMPEDDERTLDVIRELPSGWQVREHLGLKFAAPGDWVDGDGPAAPSAGGAAMSMNDGSGTLRLQVTALPTTQDPDGEFGYTYPFDPPPGADRAGAELDRQDETLHAWIEVRRAGGRTYSIDVRVPAGEDGERIVRTIAGNLEFTAEADDLPTYEDLTDARPLVDGAPEVPEDWAVAEATGFRLRVPPDWADPGGGFDSGEIVLNSPSDGEPGEHLQAWRVEPGVSGLGEIPVGGYRLDLPGVGRAVVRLNEDPAYPGTLGGFAEIRLADGGYVSVSYDGPAGPESEERFWQILGTLELVTT